MKDMQQHHATRAHESMLAAQEVAERFWQAIYLDLLLAADTLYGSSK